MRLGECLLNREKNKANNIEDGHVTRNMKNLYFCRAHLKANVGNSLLSVESGIKLNIHEFIAYLQCLINLS